MKTRHGFVSNSSSSSFVIKKSGITGAEGAAILAFISEDITDGWSIYDDGETIEGYTNMDNGALDEYLERIKFDVSKIEWKDF
jgi:hypothetical protein